MMSLKKGLTLFRVWGTNITCHNMKNYEKIHSQIRGAFTDYLKLIYTLIQLHIFFVIKLFSSELLL